MANRLAGESSPYLRQHAGNPVDWWPWGDAAFAEAARRDVPVFLSVGYSSCHWCHVMAHESFEDAEVARLLNDRFVNVKVDREERPDVDAVYMAAVQALTGHGGWPMSVFLTPAGEPFYAGTYWPPAPRAGMPGFPEVTTAVHDAWVGRRRDVTGTAVRVAQALASRHDASPADDLDLEVTDAAARLIVDQAWDRRQGGFGAAPKFPLAMTIEYLLDRHARTGDHDVASAAVESLAAMAHGGICDQVGGGFARYSTDAGWLVPHFEKMLYDNALLLAAYAKAHALTDRDDLGRTARETADYLLREMRHGDGGFFSATDADSEGVEGRFFTWPYDELVALVRSVGGDPDRYAAFFGATVAGNFEGRNILHEPLPRERFAAEHDLDAAAFTQELAAVKRALYDRRSQRVPPALDDKVLTSWNALAIRGFARAGAYLGEPSYVAAACDAAAFLEREAVADGRLHHVWKDGRATVPAFLEDVALLAGAYLDLYQVTGELRWYERASALADDALARFRDPRGGGYFQTAEDAEVLYQRPKETWDNAQPAGNSVLAEVFAKLAALTGDASWRQRADEVLRVLQDGMRRAPTGSGYALQVVEFLAAGPREVAIVGQPGAGRDALAAEVWRRPLPGTVVALAAPDDDATRTVPLLAHRTEVDGQPAAYVCQGFVCDRPVTVPAQLRSGLAR